MVTKNIELHHNNKVCQKLDSAGKKVIADKEQELEFLWLLNHKPDIKQVENGSWQKN